MLHIELARLHQPANRSEAEPCCEQPGYKYYVTTTGLACAAERQEAYREETEMQEKKGRSKKEKTRDTEHLSMKDRKREQRRGRD